MNRERLEHLVTILSKVPEKKFDISNWVSVESKCGTVACACGHAALDPVFQAQGFRIWFNGKIRNTPNALRKAITKYKNDGLAYWPHTDIIYQDEDDKEYEGFDAASRFFGLTGERTYWLFSADCYVCNPQTKHVIARIRALLDGKKPSLKSNYACNI